MPSELRAVSTKWRVTIPKGIRDALRISAGDKLLFELEGADRALVRKAEPQRLIAILDRQGPTKESGVDLQRKLRRDWTRRNHRS
jgi:AbrB family looped-hinge helix DNA binding protein